MLIVNLSQQSQYHLTGSLLFLDEKTGRSKCGTLQEGDEKFQKRRSWLPYPISRDIAELEIYFFIRFKWNRCALGGFKLERFESLSP